MRELIVDQSDWDRVIVRGADRVRFLQGLCTSNVETLPVGGWLRTAALTEKARVVAVFEVLAEEESLLLLCEPGLGAKLAAHLERFALMDDVAFELASGPMHRVWADPASVWTAPPVLAPPPGEAASAEEVEVRRVEAGLPRYGVDVGEEHFPFETPLDRHLDYTKGCYVGQEPVARVKSRGSAQKALRGLALEGEAPAAVGAAVATAERPRAGIVTSSVQSPDFGAIALAYVHRSAWDPGTVVEVAGHRARVVELPFGGS